METDTAERAKAQGESLEQRELLAQAELQGLSESIPPPSIDRTHRLGHRAKRLHRDMVLSASGEAHSLGRLLPELREGMPWELHKLYKANGWKR